MGTFHFLCLLCGRGAIGQRKTSKFCSRRCYAESLKVSKSAEDAAEWLWSRVEIDEQTGCWNWTGIINNTGYGRVTNALGRKRIHVHKAAYIVSFGDPGSDLVLHKCDNKKCCNPKHLYAGTHKMNSKDAVDRGRIAHGERVGSSKLSQKEVEIIRIIDSPNSDIAVVFNVHNSTISRIKTNKTWALSRAASQLLAGQQQTHQTCGD